LAWFLALDEGIAHHVGGTTAHRAVVDRLTNSSESTLSHAGIHTLGVDARPILGTVRAEGALWATALGLRITKESGQALAHGLFVLHPAKGIGSTGRRIARIRWRRWCQLSGTLGKCIARIARWARAHWNVVVHGANGLQATHSRTRILTLAADAGLIGRTLGVAHTFGATSLVGIANVLQLAALTNVVLSLDAAHGVGSTWRGVAGILGSRRGLGFV